MSKYQLLKKGQFPTISFLSFLVTNNINNIIDIDNIIDIINNIKLKIYMLQCCIQYATYNF